MGIGRRVRQLRVNSKQSQRSVSEKAGLAISHLSRVENDHVVPSLRTLEKLSTVLSVPVSALFDPEPVLEAGDRCPVTLSGRCILDHAYTGRGRPPQLAVEGYSAEQLEAIRLCNYLLHQGNRRVTQTLCVLLRALASYSDESRHSVKTKD